MPLTLRTRPADPIAQAVPAPPAVAPAQNVGRPARDQLWRVPTLRRASEVRFSGDLVAAALQGDIQVTFPVNIGEDAPPPAFDPSANARLVFGQNRKVGLTKNTSVSAVAVVKSFNPTQWRVEALAEQRGLAATRSEEGSRPSSRDMGAWFGARQALTDELIRSGSYDPDARVARLLVVHNQFAAVELDRDVFGGPHDEQWAEVSTRETPNGYGQVALGRLAWERPGVVWG